jgi:hypothetical protein
LQQYFAIEQEMKEGLSKVRKEEEKAKRRQEEKKRLKDSGFVLDGFGSRSSPLLLPLEDTTEETNTTSGSGSNLISDR